MSQNATLYYIIILTTAFVCAGQRGKHGIEKLRREEGAVVAMRLQGIMDFSMGPWSSWVMLDETKIIDRDLDREGNL